MNHATAYLIVFVGSMLVDLIPIIGPPAWTLMVFMLVRFELNPWLILLTGVPGSTLGRYLLSLYIPKFSNKVIKRRKNEELAFVGKKLSQKLWRSWLFVLLYSLMPLPTTPLFTAAGMAKISPLQIIPPFFVGKFASDALMLFTGRYAATNARKIAEGAVSPHSLIAAGVGLLLIGGLLFVDWRVLLQQKKLKLNFRIWK